MLENNIEVTTTENNSDNLKRQKKRLSNKVKLIIATAIIIVIIACAVVVGFGVTNYQRSQIKPEIITEATLERIINVSDLSTFEAVYNGITKVMNKEKPEKVDYYVSYEATVKAGIDMEFVDIKVDNEDKVITIIIPQVKINSIDVKMPSLDFIIENKKVDKLKILEGAYKQCKKDVEAETATEAAIYKLAEENAQNILEALIKPFVNQLDKEYRIEFK